MSTTAHQFDRAAQQYARAWAKFTNTKYTDAKRQVSHPQAQGILRERMSARSLIAVLDTHPLLRERAGAPGLGEYGVAGGESLAVEHRDFVTLALIADVLSVFTPTRKRDASVDSYELKHTVEKLLGTYVSNGALIWVAAALRIPLAPTGEEGPNLLVGISAAEHRYVHQVANKDPYLRAHHNRPLGMTYLLSELDRRATEGTAGPRWVRPKAARVVPSRFHHWLVEQAGRGDWVGDLAEAYVSGVSWNFHGLATGPEDLVDILDACGADGFAHSAAAEAAAEWLAGSQLR